MNIDDQKFEPTRSNDRSKKYIWSLAAGVCDPELPYLNIEELGILRDIKISGDEISICLAPTYSGCPAVNLIENSVRQALKNHGFDVEIIRVLSPPWTSDWISETGRAKMIANGIAPPSDKSSNIAGIIRGPAVCCPKCKSMNVEKVSSFGATACKAIFRCEDCFEPFEYFKCI